MKKVKKKVKYIKGKAQFLHDQFKDHSSTAIIAALSFLIALAWKDLVVKVVSETTKVELLEKYPYISELFSAIIITLIAIIGIALVSKWAQNPKS